jgi:outer membrane protein insertion porin family
MKLRQIFLVVSALYTGSSLAMQPFVVRDIRVEGIQRTEAGTVFSYLPVKVGETMDDDKAAQAIKGLFSTGFFKDVRLEQEGDVLVVILQERPAIAQVDFTGNKSFATDKIKPALAQIGLSEGAIFDRAVMDRAEQEIKRQYLSQGKYSAKVKAVASPLERNRVAIRFEIEEGAVAKIKAINIVGNQTFDEDDVREKFTLNTTGMMSWWTKDDQYSRQKLSADIEAMRSFYMNQGYMDFSVDSTQVSITPDKRDIYITISITEGEKYTVSDIKLAGEMLVPEEELKSLITVKAGDIFNRQDVTDSSKAIGDRLGNEGYAFANVNAVPEVDKEKKTVAFTFFVDPGRRVYVNRINLTGNTRTRDEVLRREMRQLESSWYSAERIERSKERLDHTGYFSDVNVETPAVPGTTDQVDLNVNVTEKSTGSIQFGAGLSSSEGVIVGVTVNQSNFLGTGNQVNLNLNTGKVNTTYALSFTDPYYTPDGISRGFDVYRKDVDTSSLNIGTYQTKSYGAGVRFGIPLNERDTFDSGLTLDWTQLNLSVNSPQRYIDYCSGNTTGCDNLTLRLDLGWTHDTRDSVVYVQNGVVQKLSGEIGLPGLDQQYYKATYQHTWYKQLSKYFTLMLNGQAGIAGSYTGDIYPFFKNFYAGGVSTVRGYDTSSLGPHSTQTSNGVTQDFAIGGTRMVVGNVEVFSPVPYLWDNKQFRLSAFVDAGSVWGGGGNLSTTPGTCSGASDCLRYSTGIGLSWQSPFGPIKIVYAQPLNSKTGDHVQNIQFQLGTGF